MFRPETSFEGTLCMNLHDLYLIGINQQSCRTFRQNWVGSLASKRAAKPRSVQVWGWLNGARLRSVHLLGMVCEGGRFFGQRK